jgi:hypothetical protein
VGSPNGLPTTEMDEADYPHQLIRSIFAWTLLKSTAKHATGSSSSVTRNRQSSHTGRRRSTVLMNLQLNDPALPPPGEMINEGAAATYRATSPLSMTGSPIIGSVDPHHYRTPSLGEIHQELEQEQEAQVVRQLFL